MDIVKIVRYIMMCLLEMVKMVFDGLCEHFTYKYIYICEEYEGNNHLQPRSL